MKSPATKSPYQEAVEFIDRHPGTGGTNGLAKLILSLWNEECAFSLRECIHSFDEKRLALADRIILHFLAEGEDDELRRAGQHVCDSHPRLWELGQAATESKERLRRQWQAKDETDEQE